MSLQVVGIIPARGGSKGIPRKNITLLAGKPLIAWTIQAVKSSLQVNRVIVSTDDEGIARIARDYGAEVPFLRPPELARDDTPGMAPILHAAEWLAKHERYLPDLLMCLQPTSPLRTSEDIDASITLAAQKNADAVVSVMPVAHHPEWMPRLDSDGRVKGFGTGDQPAARRQDLPRAYALNGAIYLGRRGVLLEYQTWYTDKTFAYVMPAERSLDIDTEWDMCLAELILRSKVNDADS